MVKKKTNFLEIHKDPFKEPKITKEVREHKHSFKGNFPQVSYRDLLNKPVFIARTATSVDLSGAAETLICLHTERDAKIISAHLLYEQGSSADAGITVEIGKESDRNYYYTGTTEVSKSQWYSKQVTLLKNDIAGGDTITFYSGGGKTGTGTIMLIIEWQFKN